jgi:hypothetical protein
MIAPIISIVEQITCGFCTLRLQFSVIVLIGVLIAGAAGISVQRRACMFDPVSRSVCLYGRAARDLKMAVDAFNRAGRWDIPDINGAIPWDGAINRAKKRGLLQ